MVVVLVHDVSRNGISSMQVDSTARVKPEGPLLLPIKVSRAPFSRFGCVQVQMQF